MSARRVVVALDASARSREAARLAAALARGLGVELAGLFVEDVNLLRLAGLPFARQIPVSGGPPRRVEPAAMEAQLRALAAAARQDLARAASSVHVAWTFEVRRGALPAEALAAAGESDLLLLATRIAELARAALESRVVEPQPRPEESRAARAHAHGPAAVLLLDEGSPLLEAEAAMRLLAELRLPVLVVRRRRAR